MVSAGYLLGRNVEKVVSKASLAIGLVIVAVAVTVWWVRRRRRLKAERSALASEKDVSGP